MRLLDVQAVLDREDGIRWVESQTTIFEEVLDDSPPQYAILSHCWENEVDYYEMTGLMRMDEHYRNEIKQRAGYKKIIQSCKQAQLDKYRWIWIDTCCIDKHNNSELTEAINSMYRWYSKSQKCYAYLYDVEDSIFPHQQDFSRFDKANGWPVWFSRGWTLQELIAPKQLEFFNRDWDLIGNKESLAETLEKITRIPIAVLRDKQTPRDFCVAQIMSWAADRKTTKAEDRAYSLLGLFAVNMHMTYGEGKKNAFLRLQRQIMGRYSDHSIFAWNPKGQFGQLDGSLASDPSYFRDCHGIERVNTEEFVNEVLGHRPVPDLAPLANLDDSSCLGVQIRLPVIAHQSDSESVLIRVIFACRDYYGNLITVDFKSFQSSFYRIPVAITRHVPHSPPELRTLYLARSAPYSDEDYHYFKLDDKCASYHGFTRRGSFPREFTGDTITFSSHTNDLVVLVYAARDGAKLRFAVVTGYYHGKASVHVVRDESSADHDSSWTDFSKKAYEMLWAAPIEDCVDSGVKCAHLARSIWDARVLWYTGTVETNVIVDVEQCPGCCIGPRERMTASNDPDGFVMPGLMKTVHNIRGLKLDGKCVRLCDCSGQRIRLACTRTWHRHRGFSLSPCDLSRIRCSGSIA
ncbi:heterokaryon incompatibility protein-domain-containing protein [Pisolithus marmoratus]|nr:heterokaryon incompatibility protein-domain-containing protein [Pisolithus marmoratus]